MKTVNITDELHKKLKVRSAEFGLSISELIADACHLYFINEDGTMEKDYSKVEEELDRISGTQASIGKVPKTATEHSIKSRVCQHGFPPGNCKVWKCPNHPDGGEAK